MDIPTNFTIFPESQKGQVYGTEFVFTTNLPSRFVKFAWDFGDHSNIVYNNSSPTHVYNYPGIYTVQLSSWTNYGEFYLDKGTIDVDYVARDAIIFKQLPKSYGVPGIPTSTPFVIALTSAKIDQPISVAFQSFNSKSVPHYSIPDKWKFITPNWRFVDEDGKIINGQAVVDTTPIYNEENKVVAVRGEKSFYYIDDLATGLNPEKDCPLVILVTLSTERFSYPPESVIYPYASYSNSEVSRAVISWQINDVLSSELKVTENFINDIYPIKWANVPIPIMINPVCNTTKLPAYANVEQFSATVLSYPRTNELGRKNAVNITLSSDRYNLKKGIHYKLEEDDLYFKATDEYGNVASGYVFTSLTPLSSFPGNNVIAVSTTTFNFPETESSFAFPIGFPIQPHIYISHPASNVINRMDIAITPDGCSQLDEFRKLKILVEGSFDFIKTEPIKETNLVNYFLSGHGEVYALSFNASRNRLYTADMDLNTINCYAQGITLLTSVNLEHVLGRSNLGPSYISIDSKDNLWVSLFDDNTVIKLDPNLNYLLSAVPSEQALIILEPLQMPETYLLTEDEEFLESRSPSDDVKIYPPVVETDRDDNIWLCSPSDTDSRLYKLSPVGDTLISAELPTNSFPVSLSVTPENGVWVACKNINTVLFFDKDGYVRDTITGLLSPSYVANDIAGNVCILHGYNLYSYYDIETKALRTWRFSYRYSEAAGEEITAVDEIYSFTSEDIRKSRYEDEIWGGLSADVYNRIWAVDSLKNKAYAFKVDTSLFKVIILRPGGPYTTQIWKAGDTFQTELTSNSTRSAQAAGDFTGNRWYQKYASGYGSRPVQGISTPFKIYDVDKSFKITKINETFNCAEYFKQLALPEALQNNPVLFDQFFAAVAGNGDPSKEDAGKVIYERIANFVNNKADLETAEVDSLISIAKQMAVDVKTFGLEFPVAVNRLLNLFSVHKFHLRGSANTETDITKKIGNVLTESDLITADRLYLVKDKRYDYTKIIYVDKFEGNSKYSITNIQVDGLRHPVGENYHIFTYDDQMLNEDQPYISNVINWDSDVTTIAFNLSSQKDWYEDGGIVEIMFNNLLTKQLFPQ